MTDIENKENEAIENDEAEMIEEEEIVTLTDDDGKDVDFYVLAELDHKDKWYIYLEPVDPNGEFEEGEIVIFELGEDENGEETFVPIKDETILQEVFDLFLKEMEIADDAE